LTSFSWISFSGNSLLDGIYQYYPNGYIYYPDSTSLDQSKKDIFIKAPLSVKKYVVRANISSFFS
jgi:hypothetical protein